MFHCLRNVIETIKKRRKKFHRLALGREGGSLGVLGTSHLLEPQFPLQVEGGSQGKEQSLQGLSCLD